jgi:K+-transporting ATPase A subunit
MKKRNSYLLIALFMMICSTAFSQEVEMADTMRSNGKIYVVIGIILIILIGLITYLFLLDRKVGRLEKRLKDQN